MNRPYGAPKTGRTELDRDEARITRFVPFRVPNRATGNGRFTNRPYGVWCQRRGDGLDNGPGRSSLIGANPWTGSINIRRGGS